jgi:glycosyltransferase involved in cell wall biosynthesis
VNLSVIVSTYNNPLSLEKTLWGLCCQTESDFEVLVADDGSAQETGDFVQAFARQSGLRMQHVWHEDRGFRKGWILNRAIVAAAGDYLIFLDGDCIPRDDFVASHQRLARPGYFIAGGSHVEIPGEVHLRFGRQDIEAQHVFDVRWLASRGMAAAKYRYRLTRKPLLARSLDLLTPRPGVFVGCNSSAWKEDILAVNGFDQTYTHSSDDKELGVRMTHNGVKSRRLKYSLVTVHLNHPRPYFSPEQKRANKLRLREMRARRVTWTPNGIEPANTPHSVRSPGPRTARPSATERVSLLKRP